jgi:hypothetical protein
MTALLQLAGSLVKGIDHKTTVISGGMVVLWKALQWHCIDCY